MTRVGVAVVEHHLGDGRHLDATRPSVERAKLEVPDEGAGRRDGEAEPRLDPAVLAHDLDRPRPEAG